MNKIEKNIFWSLACLNALFLVYWTGLSLNYRLHFDDVHYMADMQRMSIWEFIVLRYMTIGGNFSTYWTDAVVDKIAVLVGDFSIWPLVMYGIGIWMTFSAIEHHIRSIKPAMLFMIVVLIYNIYILTSIDLAVFTWLCAMAYYLLGPMLLLLLSYLNREQLEWWRWCIMLFLGIYIAGTWVSFPPVALSVMFVNGMWLWRKHEWSIKQAWSDIRIKKIVLMAIVMINLVVISVIAPGNYARYDNADAEGFVHLTSISQYLYGMGAAMIQYGYFMVFYLPYHLLILCIGAYFGTKSSVEFSTPKYRIIIYLLLAFVGYLILSVLPMVYVYGGFGVYRTYNHVCFVYAIMFAAIGYILGMGRDKTKILHIATYGLMTMMAIIMCVNVCIDLPVVRAYAKAQDERKAYLLQLKAEGNTAPVYVDRYPSTATPDAKYWVWRMLGKSAPMPTLYYESDASPVYIIPYKNLYGIDFDIIVKTDDINNN